MGAPPISARETDIGQSIYNNYCSACHEAGIGGAPRFDNRATWETLAKSGMDKLYAIAIHGGGNMPPKGTCITCSNFDIKMAVNYMVAASAKNYKQPVTKLIMLSNEQLYKNNCSSCHSNSKNKAPQLGDQKAWRDIDAKGFLQAYQNIITGKNGHPKHAGCDKCSDSDVIAALKYMMQKGNPEKDYKLW